MVPRFAGYLSQNGLRGLRRDVQKEWHEWRRRRQGHTGMGDDEAPLAHEGRRVTYEVASPSEDGPGPEDKLTLSETAVLSFEFCLLWSSANYFSSACLEYTSVASATILTSTSSVSTLVFCALFGVEPFSFRRLMGVAASLIGIVLISTVDMTGHSDDQRGSFPEKTAGEIALGDFMALLSAIIYGLYITIMKMRVGNEDRVDMQLFFGLAGVFNVVFLWPVFFVLDWMDIEKVGHSAACWVYVCCADFLIDGIAANWPRLDCHYRECLYNHRSV